MCTLCSNKYVIANAHEKKNIIGWNCLILRILKYSIVYECFSCSKSCMMYLSDDRLHICLKQCHIHECTISRSARLCGAVRNANGDVMRYEFIRAYGKCACAYAMCTLLENIPSEIFANSANRMWFSVHCISGGMGSGSPLSFDSARR